MKVRLMNMQDHDCCEAIQDGAEVNAFRITSAPTDVVWTSGADLIAVGGKPLDIDKDVSGFNPNILYALGLGVNVEATDEVLTAFGLVRNEGTMEG